MLLGSVRHWCHWTLLQSHINFLSVPPYLPFINISLDFLTCRFVIWYFPTKHSVNSVKRMDERSEGELNGQSGYWEAKGTKRAEICTMSHVVAQHRACFYSSWSWLWGLEWCCIMWNSPLIFIIATSTAIHQSGALKKVPQEDRDTKRLWGFWWLSGLEGSNERQTGLWVM